LNYSGDSLLVQAPTARMDSLYGLAVRYQLTQNFPNPFNQTTSIKYNLPTEGKITISVYNVLGKKIKTLVNEPQTAGLHQIDFNADTLSNGVYYYELIVGEKRQTRKMLLMH
jgi:hypothetical protein